MVRVQVWLALAWSIELHSTGESNRHPMTINILPDDIFLEVFAFCLCAPCWPFIERTRVGRSLPELRRSGGKERSL